MIITAVTTVEVQCVAKQELEHTLSIQNIPNSEGEGVQRVVEILVSDPQTIYPPEGNKRNLKILKNMVKFT